MLFLCSSTLGTCHTYAHTHVQMQAQHHVLKSGFVSKKKDMSPSSPNITSWVVEYADNTMMGIASRRYPNLKFVDISKSRKVNDKGLIVLARACKNLEKVVLNDCDNVTSAGMIGLAKSCRNLQVLSIVDCSSISSLGIGSLMTKCVNVTSSRLSGVRVTNMEVAALA